MLTEQTKIKWLQAAETALFLWVMYLLIFGIRPMNWGVLFVLPIFYLMDKIKKFVNMHEPERARSKTNLSLYIALFGAFIVIFYLIHLLK